MLLSLPFNLTSIFRPFAADPEKNTIWDITYEESVDYNNTDSTKSSSQDTKPPGNNGSTINNNLY